MSNMETTLAAYDRMLRDPCSAPIVHAPYIGTASGMLVRTVTVGTHSDTTVTIAAGAKGVGNVCMAVTPNQCTSTSGITFFPGSSGTIVNSGINSFVTQNSLVEKWRCVAACLKWIPTGAYGDRAGMVGLGYTVGNALPASGTGSLSAFRAVQLENVQNGMKAHEVRWLPTAADEFWTQTGVVPTSGGCMTMALSGVDGVASATNVLLLSGFYELTCVWEWVPDALTAGGITPAPRATPAYTTNTHQATIRNIGKFLLDGVREAGYAAGAGAATAAMAGVTYGVRGNYRRTRANMQLEL